MNMEQTEQLVNDHAFQNQLSNNQLQQSLHLNNQGENIKAQQIAQYEQADNPSQLVQLKLQQQGIETKQQKEEKQQNAQLEIIAGQRENHQIGQIEKQQVIQTPSLSQLSEHKPQQEKLNQKQQQEQQLEQQQKQQQLIVQPKKQIQHQPLKDQQQQHQQYLLVAQHMQPPKNQQKLAQKNQRNLQKQANQPIKQPQQIQQHQQPQQQQKKQFQQHLEVQKQVNHNRNKLQLLSNLKLKTYQQQEQEEQQEQQGELNNAKEIVSKKLEMIHEVEDARVERDGDLKQQQREKGNQQENDNEDMNKKVNQLYIAAKENCKQQNIENIQNSENNMRKDAQIQSSSKQIQQLDNKVSVDSDGVLSNKDPQLLKQPYQHKDEQYQPNEQLNQQPQQYRQQQQQDQKRQLSQLQQQHEKTQNNIINIQQADPIIHSQQQQNQNQPQQLHNKQQNQRDDINNQQALTLQNNIPTIDVVSNQYQQKQQIKLQTQERPQQENGEMLQKQKPKQQEKDQSLLKHDVDQKVRDDNFLQQEQEDNKQKEKSCDENSQQAQKQQEQVKQQDDLPNERQQLLQKANHSTINNNDSVNKHKQQQTPNKTINKQVITNSPNKISTKQKNMNPVIQKQQRIKKNEIVRNHEIHSLVVNLHKSQKNIKNIPLHRPTQASRQQSKRLSNPNNASQFPNLNRLNHNITLQPSVINLTVGQILQTKHKKNDQMKQMLMKQIQELKQQIKFYEHQQKQSKEINYFPQEQEQRNNQEMYLNLRNNNFQYLEGNNEQYLQDENQGNRNKTYRQSNQYVYDQQRPLQIRSAMKNKYYTPRLPKNYGSKIQIDPSAFTNHANFLHNSDSSKVNINKANMEQTPIKLNQLQGKLYLNNNQTAGQRLSNSNITTQLKDSRFSRLLKQQEGGSSIIHNFQNTFRSPQKNTITPFDETESNSRIISSPSKMTQIKTRNIGSIISLKQQKEKMMIEVRDDEVDVAKLNQLQQMQVPEKYNKEVNMKELKQKQWSSALELIKQQLESIKLEDFQKMLPNPETTQQNLVQFAHKIFLKFGINIQSSQILLVIKKYKNCILFCLNQQQNFIYHYDYKFYFGGWIHNNKSKRGLEKNQKYIYKGQFQNNKKNGYGIIKMLKQTSSSQKINQTINKEMNNSNDKRSLISINNQSQQSFVYYYGQWQNNMRHGVGTQLQFTTNHIIQFKGNWEQNKKNRHGVLSIYNKINHNLIQRYQGQFYNGFKQGYGEESFANGDMFKGQYSRNKFHGKGEYFWKNGAVYRGDFEYGIRQGNGEWLSQQNHTQKKASQQQSSQQNINSISMQQSHLSRSKINHLNRDTYKGQYRNDKKNGFGIYIWRNGTIYEGEFMNDLKHGEGVIIYDGGKKIKYKWQKGEIVSQYRPEMLQSTNIQEQQLKNKVNQTQIKGVKFRRLSNSKNKDNTQNNNHNSFSKQSGQKNIQLPAMSRNSMNSKTRQGSAHRNNKPSSSINKIMSQTAGPIDFNKNINKIKSRNYSKNKQPSLLTKQQQERTFINNNNNGEQFGEFKNEADINENRNTHNGFRGQINKVKSISRKRIGESVEVYNSGQQENNDGVRFQNQYRMNQQQKKYNTNNIDKNFLSSGQNNSRSRNEQKRSVQKIQNSNALIKMSQKMTNQGNNRLINPHRFGRK